MDRTITLWAFPVGAWGDMEQTRPLLDAFTAETGIEVKMEILSYADGDKRVLSVRGTEDAPDLILEGPERMVADWGAAGAMEDLRDMLDPADHAELHRSVLSACTAHDGAIYVYPLGRTVHCMAINVDAFRAANALQFVNLKKHTWTTEQFFQAASALAAHYGEATAAVYCGGQGGDQGTRALITNLYEGPFTDADHSQYTWNDPRIIKAIGDLRAAKGIYFDPFLSGGDEIEMFLNGKLKMAFCWNVSKQLIPGVANAGVGRTVTGEEIAFMTFPSPRGVPKLLPGIWGFGIVRHQDPGRVEAAKDFIRFVCDSDHTGDAVHLAGHFAARTAVDGKALPNLWKDNAVMREYNTILPYLGENNQITKGWRVARAAWWKMLQKVGEGGDIEALTARYVREANMATK